jgi:hypothetical protein
VRPLVLYFVILRRSARQRVRGAQAANAGLGGGGAGAADSSEAHDRRGPAGAGPGSQVGVSSATSAARRVAQRARAATRSGVARAGKRTGGKDRSAVDRAATLLGRIASLAGANEPERRSRGEESFRSVRTDIERHANRSGLENSQFPCGFGRSRACWRLETRAQPCEESGSAFARTCWIVVDFSVFLSRFFSVVSPLLIYGACLKQPYECARMAA